MTSDLPIADVLVEYGATSVSVESFYDHSAAIGRVHIVLAPMAQPDSVDTRSAIEAHLNQQFGPSLGVRFTVAL